MIEAVAMAEVMPRWALRFPQFDTVVGYSDLGHVFLAKRSSGEHGVLYPYRDAAKNYGVFGSTGEFVDTIVRDEYFTKVIMLAEHAAAIRERLGELGPGQVYFPVPYPFLGGTEDVHTYESGDVWVFLDIVGQFMGQEAAPAARRWPWSRRK
ncbi:MULTISPECIES: T6SS immunity protein Tdi1 domain-containing protein [unclassified Nocardia]|uniref:T6SS immunity protein Tdi1 domain-containing protein n=1 Tax=unclassified Nocardia TaxID=2637762 RepID=UPI0035DBA070